MGFQVVNGAMLKCSFGVAPSALVVLPTNKTLACYQPAATIMDFVPLMNIMPFGMCQSPTNPVVIAATAAKLGVFSPMPCVPAVVLPWVPGSPKVLIGGLPALNNSSQCVCLWAGIITITFAGQTTVQIP
jgi:hypothetical protein